MTAHTKGHYQNEPILDIDMWHKDRKWNYHVHCERITCGKHIYERQNKGNKDMTYIKGQPSINRCSRVHHVYSFVLVPRRSRGGKIQLNINRSCFHPNPKMKLASILLLDLFSKFPINGSEFSTRKSYSLWICKCQCLISKF